MKNFYKILFCVFILIFFVGLIILLLDLGKLYIPILKTVFDINDFTILNNNLVKILCGISLFYIGIYLSINYIKQNHFKIFTFYKDSFHKGPAFIIFIFLISSVLFVSVCNNNFHIVASEGIIFVYILGLVTFYGFFLTLSRIKEIHGRATNYEGYLLHATEILRELFDNTDNIQHGKLKILCYTPLHGNITLKKSDRGTQYYEDYKEALFLCLGNKNIQTEIVALEFNDEKELIKYGMPIINDNNCYKFGKISDQKKIKILDDLDDELWKFYKGFSDRTISNNKEENELILLEAYEESWNMLLHIRDSRRHNVKLITLKYSELPNFHFILTNDQALVGIPLRLPRPVHIRYTKPIYFQGKNHKKSNVDMIGFRTSEKYTIDNLDRTFDYYKGNSYETIELFGKNDMLYGRLNKPIPLNKNVENIVPFIFVHGPNGNHNEAFNSFRIMCEEIHSIKKFCAITLRYDAYGIGRSEIDLNIKKDHQKIDYVSFESYKNSFVDAIEYIHNELFNDSPQDKHNYVIISHGLGSYFALEGLSDEKVKSYINNIVLINWAPVYYPNKLWRKYNTKYQKDGSLVPYIGLRSNARIYNNKFFNVPDKDKQAIKLIKELNIFKWLIIHPKNDNICPQELLDKLISDLEKNDIEVPTIKEIEMSSHFDRTYTNEVIDMSMNFLEKMNFNNFI